MTKCTYIGPTSLVGTCTHTSIEGRSYCAQHYPIVYKEGSGLRKRHKDLRTAASVWDLTSVFNDVVLELEQEGVYE